MDNILNSATELNKRLLASPEYGEYLNARKRLSEYPEYMEMVNGFIQKQVNHEIQKVNKEPVDIDELALSNDYADICLITVCNDFFQAELKLLALIKAVYTKVCDGVEVEL